MRKFSSVAEVQRAVGEEFGVSEWLTIDQQRINQFAEATNDFQWIHLEEERAAQTPFKSTIAHGFLVLSLASSFCYQTYEIENLTMGVNYGLNKVRFTAPVPVNSAVRGRVALQGYDAIPGGAKLTMEVTIELEGNNKPACVAEMIALVYSA
ncbi:MAG: MaoC family dehydratase [Calditrichia bacterium]